MRGVALIPNALNDEKLISFVVVARNEATRIRCRLAEISPFAKNIYLLDAESEDATVAVAFEVYPVKVISVKPAESTRERVAKLICSFPEVKCEFLIFMGCGEELPRPLLARITSEVAKGREFAIVTYRQSITWGCPTHNQRILYALRFFRPSLLNARGLYIHMWDINRSRIHFEFPVERRFYKRLLVLAPLKKYSVVHHRNGSYEAVEAKHRAYASSEADSKAKSGARPSLLSCIGSIVIFLCYCILEALRSREAFYAALHHLKYKIEVELLMFDLKMNRKMDIKRVSEIVKLPEEN